MKNRWKTIAIVFIILFSVESIIWIWSISSYYSEIDKKNECYYDVCGEYPDAYYESDVCTCYDYDFYGDYVIAKEEWMK